MQIDCFYQNYQFDFTYLPGLRLVHFSHEQRVAFMISAGTDKGSRSIQKDIKNETGHV